ncbi:ABC transporter permease [Peloplasma aerotolerans]|jgi:peptide/nickel transport system permease protein|uniref:ABC transporter permease n=1 Tax=Peloplasma aerotolerans TaxID=3044389 RepID=A0AAW6UBS9_9MOLU|nr:ABC transporter permease [Mariniplasma sp. M4Ah]MDI6452956.1 ABC transporter permease [Mariniplasma sp. M4Ah]
MLKFLGKRLLSLIPVIIIISVMLFTIMKLMPGDPVRYMIPPGTIQDPDVYRTLYEAAERRLGLDKHVVIQYFIWFKNMVIGDFGYSSHYQAAVRDVLAEPLRNSIIINVFSISLAFLISIPVGIKSAVKKDSFHDRGWQIFSLVGISMPTFFIGLTLIFIFALNLGWLPSGGMPYENPGTTAFYLSYLRYLILPVTTLTIGALAGTIRYVRGSMLEALSKDYIRTARSKGLREKVVIYSHAFRNALIPVVTILSFSIIGLFGGSAITEAIFVWNGIGTVLIRALRVNDYNLVLVMNMFYAVLALVANIVMDISYALVDPRVKLE